MSISLIVSTVGSFLDHSKDCRETNDENSDTELARRNENLLNRFRCVEIFQQQRPIAKLTQHKSIMTAVESSSSRIVIIIETLV